MHEKARNKNNIFNIKRNFRVCFFDIAASRAREGTPGNSWWGCAARFPKSWPYFRPKKCHFPDPFSDQGPVSRKSRKLTGRKAVVVYVQERGFNSLASNIIKLSVNETKCNFSFLLSFFLTHLELKRSIRLYTPVVPSNHTRFQTKMGKV